MELPRLVACLGTTALVLVACSGGGERVSDERPASTGEPTAVTLNCARPIDTDATVPSSYEVIGNAVALPTSTSIERALQVAPSEESSAFGFGLFAKTGLLVKVGAVAEIVIPEDWEGTAGIWWGNAGGRQPSAVFKVGPCGEGVGWLAYPGGFHVEASGCVPLLIRTGDVEHRVHVPVGKSCSDQEG